MGSESRVDLDVTNALNLAVVVTTTGFGECGVGGPSLGRPSLSPRWQSRHPHPFDLLTPHTTTSNLLPHIESVGGVMKDDTTGNTADEQYLELGDAVTLTTNARGQQAEGNHGRT